MINRILTHPFSRATCPLAVLGHCHRLVSHRRATRAASAVKYRLIFGTLTVGINPMEVSA
jgi:hypothetical protein